MVEFKERIIAGQWKGKALLLPDDESVRPTRNKVRQAVFNMLGSRLEWNGMRVVDVCCGSGAWGLEAASRGAGSVILVDTQTGFAVKNVNALQASVEVVKANVREWAPALPCEVVLMDAPYGKGITQSVMRRAKEFGVSGSWWAVESGVEEALDWSGFEDVATKVYGISKVTVGKLR